MTGRTERIYCNRQGESLTSFPQAVLILEDANDDIKKDIFDIRNYRKKSVNERRVSVLIPMFLAEKKEIVSPSYYNDYTYYCKCHLEFFGDKDVLKA